MVQETNNEKRLGGREVSAVGHRPMGAAEGVGSVSVEGSLYIDASQLGLWIFLATVIMLFAGFTSAYLVRQTTGNDWHPLPLPPVLWVNTLLLVISSITMEMAKRHAQVWRSPLQGKVWLLATTSLGLIFLAGQWVVWQRLSNMGVYLPSHAHSSFFYVLTAVHALHLLGGIFVLIYLTAVAGRQTSPVRFVKRVRLCSTYWHFVGGLWLYLFVVLFVF